LSNLSSGLEFLREMPTNMIFKKAVVESAARLMSHVAHKKSTTMVLLEQMREITVGNLLRELSEEIQAHFAALKLEIKVSTEGASDVNPGSIIFGPRHLMSLCTGNIVDNLTRYAFPCERLDVTGEPAKVALCIDHRRNPADEPMVRLTVKNNGNSLKEGATMGEGGRRAATAMELFGGEYAIPTQETEVPWRVGHGISFLLW